jgi:hypothetical protein
MSADQLPARLLALELAFKSLAQLLHEQRVARLGDLAAAMEARAGLLGLMHGRASGEAAAALNELVTDLRETAAELRGGDG